MKGEKDGNGGQEGKEAKREEGTLWREEEKEEKKKEEKKNIRAT